MKLSFVIIYKYLHSQVYSLTVKFRLRVMMNKDLQFYQQTYLNFMSQMVGSMWAPLIQNVDYDNFIIKKWIRYLFIFIVIIICLYILI